MRRWRRSPTKAVAMKLRSSWRAPPGRSSSGPARQKTSMLRDLRIENRRTTSTQNTDSCYEKLWVIRFIWNRSWTFARSTAVVTGRPATPHTSPLRMPSAALREPPDNGPSPAPHFHGRVDPGRAFVLLGRVSSQHWSGPSVGSGVVVVEVLVDQAHVGLARIARTQSGVGHAGEVVPVAEAVPFAHADGRGR